MEMNMSELWGTVEDRGTWQAAIYGPDSDWMTTLYKLKMYKMFFDTRLYCNMEKEMAAHSGTLAWRIPWTEEPSGLQSVGSQRVGHDWATFMSRIVIWLQL